MGRNAQLKEKQKRFNEKPKLDNARGLRGIYFVDFEDKEFKETIQIARRKLETPNGPHCALQDKQEEVSMGKSEARLMISNKKLRVSWKPSESTTELP